MTTSAEIDRIKAACLSALRAGAWRERGDRETHDRLTYDPARGFVEDTFDSLSSSGVPESTRRFAGEREVLAELAPAEETVAAWQGVLDRLVHRRYR